mgnify:CR=1 FL=1
MTLEELEQKILILINDIELGKAVYLRLEDRLLEMKYCLKKIKNEEKININN